MSPSDYCTDFYVIICSSFLKTTGMFSGWGSLHTEHMISCFSALYLSVGFRRNALDFGSVLSEHI
jgi:hypothetical protein